MTQREYERLCREAEIERQATIEKAEIQYRSRLEALSWALEKSGTHSITSGSDQSTHKIDHGKVVEAIAAALPSLGVTFRVADVLGVVDAAGLNGSKKASISSALVRMAEEGQIEIVERGRGRKPTTFGKIERMATK